MEITFEHDCSCIGLTLQITVKYSVHTWPGNYYEPAECNLEIESHTFMCDDLDLTMCIENSNHTKLQAELQSAVEEACWNDYGVN